MLERESRTLKTYDIIRKIANGPRDDCETGCLRHYPYFKEHNKMIAIDLNKHPKAIQ